MIALLAELPPPGGVRPAGHSPLGDFTTRTSLRGEAV